MKPRLTTSQKVFHPVLFGLTHGLDDVKKGYPIHDSSNAHSNPKYPKPQNFQHEWPHPNGAIREPDSYPAENRQCPNIKKKLIKNDYRKDGNKAKPFTFFSNCSKTKEHTLEEHLICGYEQSGKKINQLILGMESCNGAIRYTGHIVLEDHPIDAFIISNCPKTKNHPFSTNAFMSDNLIIWLKLRLICIIQCSEKNEYGLLMAAVYCGLKNKLQPKNRLVKNFHH